MKDLQKVSWNLEGYILGGALTKENAVNVVECILWEYIIYFMTL